MHPGLSASTPSAVSGSPLARAAASGSAGLRSWYGSLCPPVTSQSRPPNWPVSGWRLPGSVVFPEDDPLFQIDEVRPVH